MGSNFIDNWNLQWISEIYDLVCLMVSLLAYLA